MSVNVCESIIIFGHVCDECHDLRLVWYVKWC